MTRNRLFAHLFCLLMVLVSACEKQEAIDETDKPEVAVTAVEVETARVQRGLILQLVPVSGTLAALPDHLVRISALVPGRVTGLPVIEGDTVSKGEIVARLEDSTFRDQLAQATAVLDNARANEVRVSGLYDRGIAAGKEKEDAHKDYLTAQAAYDTANIQLQRTEIRSPISGTIVQRFVSTGEQVDGTGNNPIVEVADFDPIELIATLPASWLSLVRNEQQADIKTEAFNDSVFSGTVVSILPTVDPVSGSATVRIRIPNRDHRLKGGMFATGTIHVDSHPLALLVPSSALVSTNAVPKLFVVGANSRVEERRVRVGWREGDNIEILEGVKVGEVVVTNGNYGLADEMKVIVKK